MIDCALMQLARLFFEAGLAIGISFILGFVLGLTTMTYLHRKAQK